MKSYKAPADAEIKEAARNGKSINFDWQLLYALEVISDQLAEISERLSSSNK